MKRHKAAFAAIVLVVIIVGFYAWRWPFTKKHMEKSLGQVTQCKMTIARFRRIYFPHPGYMADDVRFTRRDAKGQQVIVASLARLECVATWWAILLQQPHGKQLRLEGLKVHIPSPVPEPVTLSGKKEEGVKIDELIADGAALVIAPRQSGRQPFELQFARLRLTKLAAGATIGLDTVAQDGRAPGQLAVRAQVGLKSLHEPGKTMLNGDFDMRDVDLRRVHNLEGRLRSRGHFQGKLEACQVQGRVQVPGFGLSSSGHQQDLDTNFAALVNGTNGDVNLNELAARLGGTELRGNAKIYGKPVTAGEGKTLQVHLEGQKARIEDLLMLFTRKDPPAVTGPMQLRADVDLPPGEQQMLDRVQMHGDFLLRRAAFARHQQQKVDELSARARGQKVKKGTEPEKVLANVSGHVDLGDGRARLVSWRFAVPGATARGGGLFNMENEQVDVAGRLDMDASLSKAAGGVKSIFLFPLNPFFRKNGAGAELPFYITGPVSDPKMKLRLRGNKHKS